MAQATSAACREYDDERGEGARQRAEWRAMEEHAADRPCQQPGLRDDEDGRCGAERDQYANVDRGLPRITQQPGVQGFHRAVSARALKRAGRSGRPGHAAGKHMSRAPARLVSPARVKPSRMDWFAFPPAAAPARQQQRGSSSAAAASSALATPP